MFLSLLGWQGACVNSGLDWGSHITMLNQKAGCNWKFHAPPVPFCVGAAALSRDNAALIGLTGRLLAEAFAAGQLRVADLKQVQLAGRALVYGFARMNIDGHLPRWGVAEVDVERSAEAILDLFIEGIARRCGPV